MPLRVGYRQRAAMPSQESLKVKGHTGQVFQISTQI